MQNHYSLIYREDEREMMPTLKVTSFDFSRLCVHDGSHQKIVFWRWLHPVVSFGTWPSGTSDATEQGHYTRSSRPLSA
jgi:hypothetical protein